MQDSSPTPDWLEALTATGESETQEFKRTTGTRKEAARTVCAMLNQRGGNVLFGITPEGNVAGQQVTERTIEEIGAEIQRIDPPAFPTVERVQVAGNREVIAVRVSRGSLPPYRYRGTAFLRVGNTTRAMSSDETTGCSLNACTANSGGKTNPPTVGPSMTWTSRRSATRWRRQCISVG